MDMRISKPSRAAPRSFAAIADGRHKDVDNFQNIVNCLDFAREIRGLECLKRGAEIDLRAVFSRGGNFGDRIRIGRDTHSATAF